jgi:squalene-associated FAD-dependent desaturase
MASSKVYVIGAGLAGLSAAVRLAGRGVSVVLIEGAGQAGGRCRSYVDPTLGLTIDNGNHLVLSGNHATYDYLAAIGAEDRLAGPAKALFDFCDVRDGKRWTIRPNPGPIGWWVFSKARRAPGTKATDYLELIKLLQPQGGRRLDEAIRCEGPLWERLIEPLMLAALNTDPRTGSAELGAAVVRETLARGGRAYAPRIADPSLDAAFIAPALAFLAARGAEVRMGRRVETIVVDRDRAAALRVAGEDIAIQPNEAVIVATPAWITPTLLPGVRAPDVFSSIVNGHFQAQAPAGAPKMVGVIGGTAQWLFAFDGRIAVTVSGADALVDASREETAAALWRDVALVYGLGPDLPAWQIVKERRATFAATPEQAARRPGARTAWRNLVLAGDWTDTGLPATIEGAIRSGHKAAALIVA